MIIQLVGEPHGLNAVKITFTNLCGRAMIEIRESWDLDSFCVCVEEVESILDSPSTSDAEQLTLSLKEEVAKDPRQATFDL